MKTIPAIEQLALDLHPAMWAAMLVEQGLWSVEDIHIHSNPSKGREQVREMIDLRVDAEKSSLTLITKGERRFPAAAEPQAEHSQIIHAALRAIEAEAGYYQISLKLMERAQLLEVSEWQRQMMPLPEQLDHRQQQILAYYLPFFKVIRSDPILIQSCLQAATGQIVRLLPTSPFTADRSGPRIGSWINGRCEQIGGRTPVSGACVVIQIGPVAEQAIPDFLIGGRERLFLEQHLLPQLLPTEWQWTVRLLTAESEAGQATSKAAAPRVSMNTSVQTDHRHKNRSS